MPLTIDATRWLDSRQLSALCDAVGDADLEIQTADGGTKAMRRYRRLIRKLSGNPRVTAHFVCHSDTDRPALRQVHFGRYV